MSNPNAKKRRENYDLVSTYKEKQLSNCGLNKLLEQDTFNNNRQRHQVLFLHLLSSVQPVPVQRRQDLICSRVDPVKHDWGKSSHCFITQVPFPKNHRFPKAPKKSSKHFQKKTLNKPQARRKRNEITTEWITSQCFRRSEFRNFTDNLSSSPTLPAQQHNRRWEGGKLKNTLWIFAGDYE